MTEKDDFEANLLDGDGVDDCGGAMLSAREVWEWVEEHDKRLIQRIVNKEIALVRQEIVDEYRSGIWKRENIRGGKPCIFGTRIQVSFITDLLQQGISPEEIATKYYPQISLNTVKKLSLSPKK